MALDNLLLGVTGSQYYLEGDFWTYVFGHFLAIDFMTFEQDINGVLLLNDDDLLKVWMSKDPEIMFRSGAGVRAFLETAIAQARGRQPSISVDK